MARISFDPPKTLAYRIATWFARRRYGEMPDPGAAVGHNMQVMTETPPSVTDELVAELGRQLSGAQLVELTAIVAVENLRSRINSALGAAGVHVPRRAVDPHAPRCHTRYAIRGMEVLVSVRHSLLALLSAGPMHGYGLKTEFEAATGDVWPLNVGQVYTTLGRLERDGLVTAGADADGQKVYEITGAGRDELGRWFETPVQREVIPRQELAIKLVFAMRSDEADVAAVVQRQRVATVRALQDVTRLKAAAEAAGDLAWLLMLDALVFQAEAEARWLDVCEARLARENIAAGMARRQPENLAERAAERSS